MFNVIPGLSVGSVNILAALVVACGVFVSPIHAQWTKIQKWRQPGYFKGFNMNVWDVLAQRPANQEDFTALKATGASLVVIQTQGSMMTQPPYGPNVFWAEGPDTILYVHMLDSMVRYARTAGLTYVIAVRDGPGRVDVSEDTGQSTIWTNALEQRLYGSMLAEMARRYLPDTLFVGLALITEPNPLPEYWEPPVAVLDSALHARGIDVNALYALCIDSLRRSDPDLPLIVGGVHASSPEYFSLVNKQADPNIVYSAHCYNPAEFSHAVTPYEAAYPGSYWSVLSQEERYHDKPFLRDELYRPVRDFQALYGVPVCIGEFGLRLPQHGGERYLTDIAEIACAFGWHFALWSFNGGPEFNYRELDAIYGTRYWELATQIMQCAPTGVDRMPGLIESIDVFPNPSGGLLSISLDQAHVGGIEICNAAGGIVYSFPGPFGASSLELNLTALPKGAYFVRIHDERTQAGKLIVIR